MSFIKWLFGCKENISKDTLNHSSRGSYTKTNRLISGGHGQEALDYMKKSGIKYNIVKEYDNGVRVGNVPNHKNNLKKNGTGQSWFPKSWSREKIKRAGQVVARGKRNPDGITKYGHYSNVNVGIIRTDRKIATIFPASKQLNRKGRERNVRK